MTLYKPWSFNVASLIMYALAPGALAGILFNGGSDPKYTFSVFRCRQSSDYNRYLMQSFLLYQKLLIPFEIF